MDSFTEYAKPVACRHKQVQALLESDSLLYQEKIDGSQISFGVDIAGKIHVRSRSRVFDIEAPDGMFKEVAESIKSKAHLLTPGWTYRGEYLRRPKHNVLEYGRVPRGHVAVFDIAIGLHDYLIDHVAVEREALRCGFDYAKVFHVGPYSLDRLIGLLEAESMLGGPVEGIVLKDHSGGGFYGRDGRPVMAKFVSPKFTETHQAVFKKERPTNTDVVQAVAAAICPEARWRKAVQHLQEAGVLNGDPSDIGPLLKELARDIEEEAVEEAKDIIWAQFKKPVLRQTTRGFAEWYKKLLWED